MGGDCTEAVGSIAGGCDSVETLDDYKVVLYRDQPEGWVAEVRAVKGCYALMPTKEGAVAEVERVFEMIAAEYRDQGYRCP